MLYNSVSEDEDQPFFAAAIRKWENQIQLAKDDKKDFQLVADQCREFFCGVGNWMWTDKFRTKFGSTPEKRPTFSVTIAKAFELVALIGPVLYWRNPQREVRTRVRKEYPMELFGDPNVNPMLNQTYQQMMFREQQAQSTNKARASLMEQYLNYTPIEQPHGGQKTAAQMAITEALVTGRGTVWIEDYEPPGTGTRLTGAFYDSVDNLLIDPDAHTLQDAMWIARKRVGPTWQVEREYHLDKGSLSHKGKHIRSSEMQAATMDMDPDEVNNGNKETDLITYYEIYSKMGIGSRFIDRDRKTLDALDNILGDYVYLVVAPGVDFPLNAHHNYVKYGNDGGPISEQMLFELFDWPVPTWKDSRWPVAMLDFYPNPKSVWPIAPLSPGLGELYLINVLTSYLATQVYENSQQLTAVLSSASKELKAAIESGSGIVEIKSSEGKSINEIIQFLDKPPVNRDAWELVDRMMHQFEKRVGLNELLYGMNPGATSRTASDAKFKQEQTQIRGDHMAEQVEGWMEEIAQIERIFARWVIVGDDLGDLLGESGAFLWKKLIEDSDPDQFLREMNSMVQAGSARKPDKDRDQENLNAVMPFLSQEFSKHADMTTDTTAINTLIRRWAETMDLEVGDMQMGQRQPPGPTPEQMQAQQQQMEEDRNFEIQKQQAEVEKKHLEVQAKEVELEGKKVDVEGKVVGSAAKKESDQMKLAADHMRHIQNLEHGRVLHRQNLHQDEERHNQDLRQSDEMAKQRIDQAKELNKEKMSDE